MHSSTSDDHAALLSQIQELVVTRQREYRALSHEAQRQQGPCTLDTLLLEVMAKVVQDAGQSRSGDMHGATTALPFAIRDVPALAAVAALQMRLTSTVLAAISTHAMVTLFDLEEWVCAAEGVEHFVDLGLGVGLQVLPLVQQYFQLRPNSRVFPVRTREVLAFLLHDEEARELLMYGGGDARDLLNRFSHFYERTVLSRASSSSNTSGTGSGGQRVQNVRQLGIHVQDYATFLASLAQAAAVSDGDSLTDSAALEAEGGGFTTEAATAVLAQRELRLEQNRPLYERIVRAMDGAIATDAIAADLRVSRERRLVAETPEASTVSSALSRCLRFSAGASEQEARSYRLPLTLWRGASAVRDSSSGCRVSGLELCVQIGAAALPTAQPSCPPPVLRTEPAGASPDTHVDASNAHETPLDAPATGGLQSHGGVQVTVPNAVVRRRRGAVVSDVAALPPSEPAALFTLPSCPQPDRVNSVNHLLASLLRPAGSLGLAIASPESPSAGVAAHAADSDAQHPLSDSPNKRAEEGEEKHSLAGEGGVAQTETNDAAQPTVLEQLHVYASAESVPSSLHLQEDSAERAVACAEHGVRLLESLSPGDVVPMALLHRVWHKISSTLAEASPQSAPPSAVTSVSKRWRQRRFIPLLRPPGASVLHRSSTSTSRLASLRQRLSGSPAAAGAGCASTAASPSPPVAVSCGDEREVVCLAAPAEVCWASWAAPSSTAATSSVPSYTAWQCCGCLSQHYPSELQPLFCTALGVRTAPTLAAWCTSVRCGQQSWPTAVLTSDFTHAFLDDLQRCVEADVAARLSDLGMPDGRDSRASCTVDATAVPSPPADSMRDATSSHREPQQAPLLALNRAMAAFAEVLHGSPHRARLFPVDHAWRCGGDGLLYAPPQLCGYGGVRLAADPQDRKAPPLLALCFAAQEPSWAVRAVLEYCGVRPLDRLLETRVTFTTAVDTRASAVLHDKIAAILPYMQGYLRSSLRVWYGLAYGELRRRLRSAKILLVSAVASLAPVQLLRLRWEGHDYTLRRSIRLEYVAAHNILFGMAEDFSVPMLTEALLPLFAPVAFLREEDREGVRETLAALLGAVSSLHGAWEEEESADTQQRLRTQLSGVLSGVARQRGLERFSAATGEESSRRRGQLPARGDAAAQTNSTSERQAEVAFSLPSRPFVRFQSYFPPGTDALRQPRGPPPSAANASAGSPSAAATQRLTAKDAASLEAAGRGVRRSAPVLASVTQRMGADGRLRVTVPLPGSNGAMAVAVSGPAWSDFPLELRLPQLVDACDAARVKAGQRRWLAETSSDGSADDEKNDGAEEENAEERDAHGSEDEGIVSFHYHKNTQLKALSSRAVAASGAKADSKTASVSRKRLRDSNCTSSSSGDYDGTARSVGWYQHPPAASAAGGGAGDTPDYAVAAERFVYDALCAEYAEPMRRDGLRVIWVNEHSEAGSPFDIIVLRPRGAPSGSSAAQGRYGQRGAPLEQWEVVCYVEVKSTCTANRPEFELSLSELLFAARFGTLFKVYRVFGASTDKLRRMRYTVYSDLVQMWHRAQLTITSDIRVTPSR